MNKKLLICGAIATGLLLTACVKKEAPKEEEQEQVEVAASEPTASVPTQLEPVEEQPVVEEPTQQQVEVIREETPNTTTEIRREPTTPAETAAPKAAFQRLLISFNAVADSGLFTAYLRRAQIGRPASALALIAQPPQAPRLEALCQ